MDEPTVYKKYIEKSLKTKTAPLPCVTPNPVSKAFQLPKSERIKWLLLVENKKTGKGWTRSGQFFNAGKATQLGIKMESKGFRVAIQKGLSNPRVQINGQPKTPSKRIYRVWVKEHDF